MFNYDAAIARVDEELAKLADQLRPILIKDKPYLDERASFTEISGHLHFSSEVDENSRNRFQMLYDFHHITFWHALNFLQKIRETLSDEDVEFYSTLAIEQAKNREDRE